MKVTRAAWRRIAVSSQLILPTYCAICITKIAKSRFFLGSYLDLFSCPVVQPAAWWPGPRSPTTASCQTPPTWPASWRRWAREWGGSEPSMHCRNKGNYVRDYVVYGRMSWIDQDFRLVSVMTTLFYMQDPYHPDVQGDLTGRRQNFIPVSVTMTYLISHAGSTSALRPRSCWTRWAASGASTGAYSTLG